MSGKKSPAAAAAAAAAAAKKKPESPVGLIVIVGGLVAIVAVFFASRSGAAVKSAESGANVENAVKGIRTPKGKTVGNVSSIVPPSHWESAAEWAMWRTRSCEELARDWLYTKGSFRGFHVLCFNPADGKETDKLPEVFSIDAYQHGQKTELARFDVKLSSLKRIREVITEKLHIVPLEGIRQPWAFFNRDGRRVETLADLQPLMLLFEGGQWLWPGVEIGFRRVLRNMISGEPDLVLETLALQPLIIEIQNFLSHSECDDIVRVALPNMFTSEVAHQDKDVGKPSAEWRTSSQWWYDVKYETKPVMGFIQKRVAELSRVPASHQELPQILQYLPGQKYVAHHDYFDLRYYSNQASFLEQYDHGGKNRLATVFWYLSTVHKGGATNFPMAHGGPHPTNFSDCTKGLSVQPQKAKVIIFYSMRADGSLDEYSLHAGCPPLGDEKKYSSNFWLWNKPTGFVKA